VAFALRDNLELLVHSGIDCREITSLGGGARSKLWLQIKADVLQRQNKKQCNARKRPVWARLCLLPPGPEVYANIEAAIAAMVHPAATISPDIHNQRSL
jgi:xylulokinase